MGREAAMFLRLLLLVLLFFGAVTGAWAGALPAPDCSQADNGSRGSDSAGPLTHYTWVSDPQSSRSVAEQLSLLFRALFNTGKLKTRIVKLRAGQTLQDLLVQNKIWAGSTD